MMTPIRTRNVRAIAVAIVAGSLALTGCSDSKKDNSKDTSKSKGDAAAQSKPVAYGDVQASTGPAQEVTGAKPGGTINVYMQSDLSHMDPGQIYVSDSRPVRQPAPPWADELPGGRQGQPDGRR